VEKHTYTYVYVYVYAQCQLIRITPITEYLSAGYQWVCFRRAYQIMYSI